MPIRVAAAAYVFALIPSLPASQTHPTSCAAAIQLSSGMPQDADE